MNTGDEQRISLDTWMSELNSQRVGRVDMNKLIMNYLVTGEIYLRVFRKFLKLYFLLFITASGHKAKNKHKFF